MNLDYRLRRFEPLPVVERVLGLKLLATADVVFSTVTTAALASLKDIVDRGECSRACRRNGNQGEKCSEDGGGELHFVGCRM